MYDYSQAIILSKLVDYINCKYDKCITDLEKYNCRLPFNGINGLCNGLVAYWLHSKRLGNESKFLHRLQYIATWDKKTFIDSGNKEDLTLEEFLNMVGLLQFDNELRYNDAVNQSSLDKSINLIINDIYEQVAPAEFSATFVFNQTILRGFLPQIMHNNKMLRISNGFHALGAVKIADKYYFYNPDSSSPRYVADIDNLVYLLFSGLEIYDGSTGYVALRLDCYDLQGEPTAIYPNMTQFFATQLQDSQKREAFIKHPNILRVAARYNDYKTLDALFDSGYSYIPWQMPVDTELNDAVLRNDRKMLQYLLAHNVPINFRMQDGLTASATAVRAGRLELLYDLITHGADLNSSQYLEYRHVKLAIQHYQPEILVVLLGFGSEIIPKEDIKDMEKKFGITLSKTIINRALTLNAKVLRLPSGDFNLNQSTYRDIIAYLQHSILRIRLEGVNKIKDLVLKDGDRIYKGENCISQINKYMRSRKNYELASLAEVMQIDALVDRFPHVESAAYRAEMLKPITQVFADVEELILAKPPREHSKKELKEIRIIIEMLEALVANLIENRSDKYDVLRDPAIKLSASIVDYCTKYKLTLPAYTLTPRQSLFFHSSYDWQEPMPLQELKTFLSLG